jgi:DNA-binding NtrC family response regulator
MSTLGVASPQSTKQTILAVDDDTAIVHLCAEILERAGFSVLSATNEFPNVHGHELAVRALRMRKDLRVILMSGNIDQELAGYGIRRGVVPFLPKPLAHQTLVALVRQTLHAPPPSVESLTAGPPEIPKSGDEWVD